MTDTLPEIVPSVEPGTGQPVAVIDADTFADFAALLAAAPGLTDPANAAELAAIWCHFARPMTYRVIDDPAAFEAAYRERIAGEDRSAPWVQGVNRLSDFGMPDFGAIKTPAMSGGTLSFVAEDALTGLPYAGTGPAGDPSSAAFEPLPLAPLPPVAPAMDEDEDQDADRGIEEPTEKLVSAGEGDDEALAELEPPGEPL